MSWLITLLGSIIRPIIREEFANLKLMIRDSMERTRIYEQYDRERDDLTKEMAEASTSEERWAILQKIKNARPKSLG